MPADEWQRTRLGGARVSDPLVEVDDLRVWFPIRSGIVMDRHIGDVKAVDGVSLRIERGETLGLVGESGCGKSTVGRALLRLYEPTGGKITFDGTDITHLSEGEMRPLRKRMQMIFQDPYASLNPRHSVGRMVGEPLRVHGRGGRGLSNQVRELLQRVGLPADAASRYPHEFSGGQRQRIGLARALALNPDFLVCDEPVSALDVSIQAQIVNLMEELQRDFELTYLFIAHDLAVVRHISDRIAVMYLGQIMELSPADDLYDNPLHPYTISLLSAIPIPDPEVERNRTSILLQGDLPSPANPPHACRFHTRCPYVQETRCRDDEPELRPLEGHLVKCHFAEEIKAGQIQPRSARWSSRPGSRRRRTSRRSSDGRPAGQGRRAGERRAVGLCVARARRGRLCRRDRPAPGDANLVAPPRRRSGRRRMHARFPELANEELDVLALELPDDVDRQRVRHGAVPLLAECGLLSPRQVCDPPLETEPHCGHRQVRSSDRGAGSDDRRLLSRCGAGCSRSCSAVPGSSTIVLVLATHTTRRHSSSVHGPRGGRCRRLWPQ